MVKKGENVFMCINIVDMKLNNVSGKHEPQGDQ